MTDLERTREILEGYPLETAQYVIAEALAATRREGAEEMRERAIAELHEWARDQCFIDIADPADWERVLRALPLTPEEPSHD